MAKTSENQPEEAGSFSARKSKKVMRGLFFNMRGNLDFEKSLIEAEQKVTELKKIVNESGLNLSKGISALERDMVKLKQDTFENLTAWNKLGLATHEERPQAIDYITEMFDDPIELRSDRIFGDDRALRCGLAWFEGQPIVYLGQQKGKDLRERLETNDGYMHPEGYRKARRMMKLAERFNRPLISLVDTPAAHPGAEAEARGQAFAIADNLAEMAMLNTPIIAIILSEGGSGGALGVALADRVLMLEYAIYCVCPPETCSTILWKDNGEHAPEASKSMGLTASDLLKFGIIDEIIEEPLGGAHCRPDETIKRVRRVLSRHLNELMVLDRKQLLETRYQKYRGIGVYGEDKGD